MHILFIAPYPPTLVRPRSRNFLRQMMRHGHQITVVTLSIARIGGDEPSRVSADRARVMVVPKSRARAYFSALRAVPTRSSLEVAYCSSGTWQKAVNWVAQSDQIDLVHVEHLRGAAVARHLPLPKIWDAVDSRSLVWERASELGSGITKLLGRIEAPRTRRFEQIVAHEFDAVLVSSPVDQQAFHDLQPSVRTSVVPNGVDLAYFSAKARHPQAGAVIMTGVMNYPPNIDAAVRFCRDAWPIVASGDSQAHLWLVGSSPSRAVRSLVSANVSVTGFVEDIRPYLAGAMVAVCPTRLGAGSQYKVLEAIAAGVPVVCSQEAAQALGLVPDRHLLVARDEREMAQKVRALLVDLTMAARLSSAARTEVDQRFAWDRIGDQLDEIHRGALAAARNQ